MSYKMIVHFVLQRPCGDWSVWHVENALMEQIGSSLGSVDRLMQQWQELCENQQLSFLSRQTLVSLVQKVQCHLHA